ncbi:MAG TPA: MBL fold metallo-hydrolase [Campylobacterales bacterium]|nr:MBL fold metallo-hydrolase [Campylobacterales bacterium]HIP41281.1 MBL fold metallo-hydrolase [Campylobacterales bacterium]
MKTILFLTLPLVLFAQSITLQILGSGGPEFSKRASSSYLVWVDGKARIMIDAGGGAFLRFSQSGAKIEDLSFIALTHLHIDHASDLPAFMKAGYFSKRTAVLPILGTTALGDFPNINEYLERLFGKRGAYAYMNDILTPQSDSFQLKPILFDQGFNSQNFGDIVVGTVGVTHGKIPAIAYCINIGGKKIIFAGDTSASSDNLIKLAQGADYLIVHHAIPQDAGKFAKRLHVTPKRIGEVAGEAKVKNLILSHRMKRTYGSEDESLKLIRENFSGNIYWGRDLMVLPIN